MRCQMTFCRSVPRTSSHAGSYCTWCLYCVAKFCSGCVWWNFVGYTWRCQNVPDAAKISGIRENESSWIFKIPEESLRILKNPEKSWRILKNPQESSRIPKNPQKFLKILRFRPGFVFWIKAFNLSSHKKDASSPRWWNFDVSARWFVPRLSQHLPNDSCCFF